jgi:conjugal transfer pilus assembly protein TraF
MAANMWYFNMVQKPDLDPTVTNPISEVGIALASKIKDASQLEYFRLIREEGGVLFYFTRNDCSFCHDQAPFTRRVAQTMGLQLINIPLDGICIEGFEGDNCGDNITQEQVQPLNVAVVPTIYLYVPSNTWIRLGTGITSDSTILANTVNFFSAYRAAMLQGLTNGDGVRPSVSFDPNVRGEPTGVVRADGAAAPGTPDRSKLLEMMGYSGAASKK